MICFFSQLLSATHRYLGPHNQLLKIINQTFKGVVKPPRKTSWHQWKTQLLTVSIKTQWKEFKQLSLSIYLLLPLPWIQRLVIIL